MRWNHFFAVLSGLAAIALLAADASAMYHPTLGRFLQRDPVGYRDGMGLYEYGVGRPHDLTDPAGLGAVWVEAFRPVMYQDHASLNVDRPPGKKIRLGVSRPVFGFKVDPGIELEPPDCCYCWYNTVTVTITYKTWISSKLGFAGFSELKQAVLDHEKRHVDYDFQSVFKDLEMRRQFDIEVEEHDTRAEAFLIRGPKSEEDCKTECESEGGKKLDGPFQDMIGTWKDVMRYRADEREEYEGPGFVDTYR